MPWIEPPIQLDGLNTMVEHSTILPQCIRAYKDNIAGFGIGVRYIDDIEETDEMRTEYSKLEAIIDQLNLEMDTKEVFEDIIEAREIFGIAYLEVIRNIAGEVNQIDFIKETKTIRKTAPIGEIVPTEFFYKGQPIIRQKKFRKYKQELNGKTVFFKEFGDSRTMDSRTGQYSEDVDISYQANEILEFVIGSRDYGTVRWIGQSLNVDGSRRAENLNNNYFQNGRHTPLMIIVRGGSLSEESFTKLQSYMDGIKGENGQHSFMVLEVEDTDSKVGFEDDKQPSVDIKDMASILQKDELFQDYLDNSRKKVQSAFRLPDLYVGYTTDFNRATAQTAQEITEQQVFIPERKSLAWAINNKLLNSYGFKHVEVYFKAPDITNPDDMVKILNVTERAGGLTPNIAKDITQKTLGKTSEDYTEKWGDIPLAVSKTQAQHLSATDFDVTTQLDNAIKKATVNEDQDVVAVMKAVKKELLRKEE
nr:phage portal protein [Anaerovorax sp. IOR16]